jgi:uncharacterized protein YndB with AHSA1/START domain
MSAIDQASTDRIERQVVIRAPRARVWKALTDQREFSEWFGVRLDGPFAPGTRVTGQVTMKGYEHVPFEIWVDRMEKEKLFSWRWHPGETEPGVDYSAESKTHVVFELTDVPGGTLVKVVETGFDQLPADRRPKAFRDNTGGWEYQIGAIRRHVEGDGAAAAQ